MINANVCREVTLQKSEGLLHHCKYLEIIFAFEVFQRCLNPKFWKISCHGFCSKDFILSFLRLFPVFISLCTAFHSLFFPSPFDFSLGFWPKTEINCILQHMALTHWNEAVHPPLTKLKRTRKRKTIAKLIHMVSQSREAGQGPELHLLCQPAYSRLADIPDLQWPQWRVNRKCVFQIFLILISYFFLF